MTQRKKGRSGYPDPPWRLSGRLAGMAGLVPISTARRAVPGDVTIARIVPGYTAGAILVGEYRESSVGPYSELIVIPALVRVRGGRGFWISQIYVDDEDSRDGGREIWGLPKEMAHFEWEEGSSPNGRKRSSLLVKQGDSELLNLEVTQQPIPFPGRYKLPLASRQGDRYLRWHADIHSKVHKVHADLFVPPESPLSGLRPLPSTAFAGDLESMIISRPI